MSLLYLRRVPAFINKAQKFSARSFVEISSSSSYTYGVDRFMDLVKIDKNMMSDPVKVQSTLEKWHVDDFTPGKHIFSDLLEAPVDLSGFIADIRDATLTLNPAMEDFLYRAIVENRLITEQDSLNEHVESAIYSSLILDRLTKEMADKDTDFMYLVRDHFMQKREAALGGEKEGTFAYYMALKNKGGSVFEIIKTLTMDKVFRQYIEFREKGDLDDKDLKAKNVGLKLNIAEAIITDLSSGNSANGEVGWKLWNSSMKDIYTTGENNFIKQSLDNFWVRVYNTWVLAFVTGSLNDLHLIYPKMLIPCVIGAEEDDYLFYRGLSLYVTMNILLLKNSKGAQEVVLPNAKELSKVWGQANLDYAKKVGF